MSRVVRGLVLVAATAFAVEWIHYRMGEPTVWTLLHPQSADERDSTRLDPESVTESEFQSYVHVLEKMQADHTVPIEKAIDAENLPLERFRDIEQRVQRNDVLVERARELLRKNAEILYDSRRAVLDHG